MTTCKYHTKGSIFVKIFQMKAIIRKGSGKDFKNLGLVDVPSPSPGPDEVLVQMHASRINPADLSLVNGMPFAKFKSPQICGVDGAGKIIARGENVKGFKEGDRVSIYRHFNDFGTWAENVSVPISQVSLIPSGIDLYKAGSISLTLLTAYESIKKLEPKPGCSILVHGAGGGVGYMAVLVAKAMGLRVIVNASARDKERLETIGIDRFLDYKEEDFSLTLKDNPPDYIFDIIGKDTLKKSITLQPKKVVSIAYSDPGDLNKVGIKFPGILVWLMRVLTLQFPRMAKAHGVELIGQVTGPNQTLMDEASQLILTMKDHIPEPIFLDLKNSALPGKKDIGKTIRF